MLAFVLTTTIISATGGARLRADDRKDSDRVSESVGKRILVTKRCGHSEHPMLRSATPRVLVIRTTTSSKSALS